MCPVVELTGLGSLCLSKSGGVPRMCESGENSGNFQEISLKTHKDLESCPSILGVCPCALWSNGLG